MTPPAYHRPVAEFQTTGFARIPDLSAPDVVAYHQRLLASEPDGTVKGFH